MALDFAECDRARLARDPSYDGRFFTGVRTTGIYCRPVCPVRPARSANVQYFPSAAAAELAGFRPCLRCRPETAPFSGAWKGSRATVERAMRLIVEEGALDEEGASVGFGRSTRGGWSAIGQAVRSSCKSEPSAGRKDRAGATRKAIARRYRSADDRDRDARRFPQSSPLQRRLCRSLPQTADRG